LLINEQNLNVWYRAYNKQFDTTTKYIKSRKGQPQVTQKVKFEVFKEYFLTLHAENPSQSGMSIAKDLAKDQLYAISYKQARSLARAHVKQFGGESSINLEQMYRVNSSNLGDKNILKLVASERATLAGSETQKNIYIGQKYFGSE
jgi:hypothetical protein